MPNKTSKRSHESRQKHKQSHRPTDKQFRIRHNTSFLGISTPSQTHKHRCNRGKEMFRGLNLVKGGKVGYLRKAGATRAGVCAWGQIHRGVHAALSLFQVIRSLSLSGKFRKFCIALRFTSRDWEAERGSSSFLKISDNRPWCTHKNTHINREEVICGGLIFLQHIYPVTSPAPCKSPPTL